MYSTSTHQSRHLRHLFQNRKTLIALVAILTLLSASLLYAALTSPLAFAENSTRTVVDTQGNEITVPTEQIGQDNSSQNPSVDSDGLTPADNCSITLKYYEIVQYDDPDEPVGDDNLRLLGSRTLSGFHEGDVVDAWDYVVNIPGHFFWDGWPGKLTVSRDPNQNVIVLHYVKLWNAEYTVNYYVMTGADLTADTWSEALAPEEVTFTKMGSETFTNQRFDALIKGDAYEYKLNDMYVIDTYPAEIRLGTDPDNNVINVLYVPELATLPDQIEIPDEQLNHDDLITTLPDDVIVEDFASTDTINPDEDTTIDITDDMLNKPVNKAEAEEIINAYDTGLEHAKALAQTGDTTLVVVSIIAGIALVAVVVLVIIVWRRKK